MIRWAEWTTGWSGLWRLAETRPVLSALTVFLVLCARLGGTATSQWGGIEVRCTVDLGTALDLATGAQPRLSHDGRLLYVPSFAHGVVRVFDLSVPSRPRLIQSVATGAGPVQTDLSEDGKTLGVVNETANSVSIFDVAPATGLLTLRGTFAPARIDFARNNVEINAFGNWSVIAAAGTGRLLAFDSSQAGTYATPLANVPTSPAPTQVMMTRFDQRVLVMGGGTSNTVDVFDRVIQTNGLVQRGSIISPTPLSSSNGFTSESFGDWVIVASEANDIVHVFSAAGQGTNRTPQISLSTPDAPLVPHISELDDRVGLVCAGAVAFFDFDLVFPPQGGPAVPVMTPRGVLSPPPPGGFAPGNSLVFDDGALNAYVASVSADEVLAADATIAGDHPGPIAAGEAQSQPRFLCRSGDGRRLAVANDAANTVTVYDVERLEVDLYSRGSFTAGGVLSTAANVPAISGDGDRGVTPNSGASVFSFDSSQIGAITTALDTESSLQGPEAASLSASGPFLAVTVPGLNTVEFFGVDLPTGALTPAFAFTAFGGISSAVPVAWHPSLQRAYVPSLADGGLRVVNPLTQASIDTETNAGAVGLRATVSPAGNRVGLLAGGNTPSVTFYAVQPAGTVTPAGRYRPASASWAADNNVAFSADGNRAVVASLGDGSVRLLSGARTGTYTDEVDVVTPGVEMTLAAVTPDGQRAAVLDTETTGLRLFDLTATSITERAFVDTHYESVTRSNNLALTPDGAAALVSTVGIVESQGTGSVLAIDTRLVGETSARLDSVRFTGSLGRLALSADGRRLVVIRSLGPTAPGTVEVLGVGQGAPPQIVRATLFERFGAVNGTGVAGDRVALTFDQPVEVLSTQTTAPAQDFFTTDGALLGSPVNLQRSLFAPNVVLLTLGPGTANVRALGTDPATSTSLDIGEDPPFPRIASLINGMPARDTGVPFLDDTGIDLRLALPSRTTLIAAIPGGTADLPQNESEEFPDYTFTRHRLVVPPGSLLVDTSFTLGPPPDAILETGLPSALHIASNATDPQRVFRSGARLEMQYDPAEVDLAAGQLEHLMAIFQMPLAGDPVLVPGLQTVDTGEETVSVDIDGLDPANLVPGDEGPARRGAIEDEVGTFATIPINPVEERQWNVGPGSAGDAATLSVALQGGTGATLSGGNAGAYTLHTVTLPGYVLTSAADPNRIQVKIRTATLFERVSFGSGQNFPGQSGAIFAIQTANAAGTPIAFTSPAEVTVQFISRADPSQTDVVSLAETAGQPIQMRPARDTVDGADVSFALLGGDPGIDLSAGTVTLANVANLTGTDGLGVYGAVVDPNAPISLPTETIVQHLLGQTTLSTIERLLADRNADGRIDVADVVRGLSP